MSGQKNLPASTGQMLHRMLRVNHAGELGADAIYRGQLAVFRSAAGPESKKTSEQIQHMWDQEKVHLSSFETLLRRHSVRPSALAPLWYATGYGLGYISASMGKESAMALTEAIETVIGDHYNDQLRTLSTLSPTIPTGETTLSEETLASLNQLKTLIQVCRDDELGHRDLAVQEDAQKALGHSVLSNLTQMGCKLAISIAKRI